jgi:hypothetical protein
MIQSFEAVHGLHDLGYAIVYGALLLTIATSTSPRGNISLPLFCRIFSVTWGSTGEKPGFSVSEATKPGFFPRIIERIHFVKLQKSFQAPPTLA